MRWRPPLPVSSLRSLLAFAGLAILISACATTARPEAAAPAAPETTSGAEALPWRDSFDELFEEEFDDPADRDPIEKLNRATFALNETLRGWILTPISRVYEFAVPEPGRRAVFRFFTNLGEPVILLNHLLQLTPVDAGTSGARFLINTTIGVAGFLDPASGWGFEKQSTDFGQTLAVYTVRSGPYVVIPLLGPSTARDAVGNVVDSLLRPDTWLLGFGPRVVIGAGAGIATYDVERERLEALRETSVDFYAALRGAYLLDREALVSQRLDRVRGSGDLP